MYARDPAAEEAGMAFDFKKEYRDLYQAKTKPVRIEVPAMTFAAVMASELAE